MQIAIISTALGIVLFLCGFLGFKEGLRLGMTTVKGIPPTPPKNPIQAVTETVDEIKVHHENAEYDKELAEMLAYTGDALPKKG